MRYIIADESRGMLNLKYFQQTFNEKTKDEYIEIQAVVPLLLVQHFNSALKMNVQQESSLTLMNNCLCYFFSFPTNESLALKHNMRVTTEALF